MTTMSSSEMLEEIARWRLAYDTVSAMAARVGGEQGTTTAGNDVTMSPRHPGLAARYPGTTTPAECPVWSGDDERVATALPYNHATMSHRTHLHVPGNDRVPPMNGTAAAAAAVRTNDNNAGDRPRIYGSVTTMLSSVATTTSSLVHTSRDPMPSSMSLPSSPRRRLRQDRLASVDRHRLPAASSDVDVRDFGLPPTSFVSNDPSSRLHDGLVAEPRLADVQFPFEPETLVELFRRLSDTFYTETYLWIYMNVVGRRNPTARRVRHRLRLLGAATGRSYGQATVNVLTGYLSGYRQSRMRLADEVETALRQLSADDGFRQQAGAQWLGRLAVELGVALNPRQMLRSFSAVVRDLVDRTVNFRIATHLGDGRSEPNQHADETPSGDQVGLSTATQWHRQHPDLHMTSSSVQLTPETSGAVDPAVVGNHAVSATQSLHHHQQQQPGGLSQYHVNQSLHRQPSTSADSEFFIGVIPPPPPPYPSFLLHFLTMITSLPGHQGTQENMPMGDFSYETLISLSDQLGEAKGRGLSMDAIRHLSVYVYDVGGLDEESMDSGDLDLDPCVICLDHFSRGQLLRVLPCRHQYHAKCVDKWLQINRTCPVCRFDINPVLFTPASFV